MLPSCRVGVIAIFSFAFFCSLGALASETPSVEFLLRETSQHLHLAPEKAVVPLEKLSALQSTFTQAQKEEYKLASASSLGFRGKNEERVALAQSFLDQVKSPGRRASFLYELIDGYTVLGKYALALLAMNESILLLPLLESTGDKIQVLQGALALMDSFRAYDEALDFAERIYVLRDDNPGSYAACVGLTDKVEMNFARGNSALARSFVKEAIRACDANKNLLFTLIVKINAAIDLIDSANYPDGIATSLPLLDALSVENKSSDYVTRLEEAVARAYLKTGNTERAEHFGLHAYQSAQSGNGLLLQEKTSETMAVIKRAQGQLASAIAYYDTNLALKKKVLDDQSQKNLAYQRVKFDTQDKINQMALLQQKNKNLSVEKALQHGKYENLILLMTLILVALTILAASFIKTFRQKNVFRISAQVDGLTQVSNRAHFTVCAHQVFKNGEQNVSVVLFDMDQFKKINDTYGHFAGDWVLKAVCLTVKPLLQKADCFGRLGGEEFSLCLPNLGEVAAYVVAERCRVAIAAINTLPCGFDFPISASFGVATRGTKSDASFEETLVQADKALYLSKNEGRNRVTVHQHKGIPQQ